MTGKEEVIVVDNKSLKEYSNRKIRKDSLEKRDYIYRIIQDSKV